MFIACCTYLFNLSSLGKAVVSLEMYNYDDNILGIFQLHTSQNLLEPSDIFSFVLV